MVRGDSSDIDVAAAQSQTVMILIALYAYLGIT
jgi:hypothetical protein